MTGKSVPDPGNRAPPENEFENILVKGPADIQELSVTNETLVNVYLGANQSVTAGNWTTVNLDTENKDELAEFDTGTHQFTPDETGWYLVLFSVHFFVGADQDLLQARFRNATTTTVEIFRRIGASGTADQNIFSGGIIELTAGDNYDLQAMNASSADTLVSGSDRCFLHIRRVFR